MLINVTIVFCHSFSVSRSPRKSTNVVLYHRHEWSPRHLSTWSVDESSTDFGWIRHFLQHSSFFGAYGKDRVGQRWTIASLRSIFFNFQFVQKLLEFKKCEVSWLVGVSRYHVWLSNDWYQGQIWSLARSLHRKNRDSFASFDYGIWNKWECTFVKCFEFS